MGEFVTTREDSNRRRGGGTLEASKACHGLIDTVGSASDVSITCPSRNWPLVGPMREH